VQPRADAGYFNFEFNGGGSLLCYYVTDPRRVNQDLASYVSIPKSQARAIAIYHSLPALVDPEIEDPVDWVLGFFIPFTLLETYVGPLRPVKGQTWRGNFYKCAEENSHPHWAAWAPVDELNFHLPRCFGALHFLTGKGQHDEYAS
jgi:hypothetical protein